MLVDEMFSHCLPVEVSLMVLQVLVDDGCSLARFATVSHEWQRMIEQYTFTRIKLTPSSIADLDAMTSRNQDRVRYLWLCLELERCDCTRCNPEYEEIYATSSGEDTMIMTAFWNLFSVLSSWHPHGCLTLDISIYSTSDSEHWFKYLTFEPDVVLNNGSQGQRVKQTVLFGADEDQHRWDTNDFRLIPPLCAIEKVFVAIMSRAGLFDDGLPELKWWRQTE